ncbi:hypothetical protein GGI07_003163 [Coemansia sp. Benny D115]|nr:hypothetical protein GGI07_003163 [Coemansia sp. Benny D115]
MPDTPAEDKKPVAPRAGSLRGRGRGRGGLPGQRLSSIHSSGAAAGAGGGGKMVFAPTIPARRNKKEPSALVAAKPEVKSEPKGERGRGRGRGGMNGQGRGRMELIQAVTGPFAQGPASLGSFGRGGRRGMTGNAGVLPPGVSAGGPLRGGAQGEDDDDDAKPRETDTEVVAVINHNEIDDGRSLEVQTEEMALAEAEAMEQLSLDFEAAAVFGTSEGESVGRALEDRLVVFQVPHVPEFDLGPEVLQRRLAAKQRKVARRRSQQAEAGAAGPVALDLDASSDVKPNVDEDVKPNVNEDIKPDLARLALEDAPENESEDEGDANGGLVDGRIGTLVLLRSGAVRLRIGDILLDVARGADCQFMRGLFALDMRGGNTAVMLGNVDQQFVCTPDLEGILR